MSEEQNKKAYEELEKFRIQFLENLKNQVDEETYNRVRDNLYGTNYDERKAESKKKFQIIKDFSNDITLNFNLDYHLDEEFDRLYIYPDGIKNQKEFITIANLGEHQGEWVIDMCGYGEKTNVNFVCSPENDGMYHCLYDIIKTFRENNNWNWTMPCENIEKQTIIYGKYH